MIQFADEARIEVSSGKGGNGCVAFRREKYVPNGGPAGGDGGRGGDVIFVCKRNLRTLAHLRHKTVYRAKNGGDGSGGNRYGKDGEDIIIPLPPGTTVRDYETNELICEFTTESENSEFKFLEGGKGGWGNMHFKTSTNQAPKYAHAGKPGETRKLRVELSVMADVGLVGFPNAGKSSLLDYFTNARPKIAPYPFTTKIPNLGVLRVDDEQDIIIADIPGIIEGASEGAGLGIRFLKHISRTMALIFMIDCSDENALTAFDTLRDELKSFNEDLASKPRIVLLNKMDIEGAPEVAEEIKSNLKDEIVIPISVQQRYGLDRAKKEIQNLVADVFAEKSEEEVSSEPKISEFMRNRADCDDEGTQYPGSEM